LHVVVNDDAGSFAKRCQFRKCLGWGQVRAFGGEPSWALSSIEVAFLLVQQRSMSAYNASKRLLHRCQDTAMNWSGSFANSVLPSHAVISECSIKAYIDSQHGLIRKSLYLLPATLKKDRS
jgi:hypothetical protein